MAKLLQKLGAGGNGVVYLMQDHKGNKFVRKSALSHGINDLDREYQTLKTLRDVPGVPKIRNKAKNFLDTEYIPDAKDLTQYHDLNSDEIIIILHQVMNILKCIHAHGYVHRDLKRENILYVRQSMTVTIIDWGSSIHVTETDQELIHNFGTCFTLPPEAVDIYGAPQDWFKIDVWQLGVMIYELTTNDEEAFLSATQSPHDAHMKHNIRKCQWNRRTFKRNSNNPVMFRVLDMTFQPEHVRINLAQMQSMLTV
jgi:serine/threonine protein kinase